MFRLKVYHDWQTKAKEIKMSRKAQRDLVRLMMSCRVVKETNEYVEYEGPNET